MRVLGIMNLGKHQGNIRETSRNHYGITTHMTYMQQGTKLKGPNDWLGKWRVQREAKSGVEGTSCSEYSEGVELEGGVKSQE